MSVSQSEHWLIYRRDQFCFVSALVIFKIIIVIYLFTNLTQNLFIGEVDIDLFLLSFVPIKVYNNVDTQKEIIINDNREKSGVYRWINKENNKSYIGSSINLVSRFFDYFNLKQLINGPEKNTKISRALVKYGYSGFILEVLEYCNKNDTIEREQFYIDLFKPEYNILKKAGSLLGYKHSVEARKKIINAALTRKVSEETRVKMRAAHLGKKRTLSAKALDNLKKRVLDLSKKKSFKVSVTDTSISKTVIYDSVNKAAEAIGCSKTTILSRENCPDKLVKNRYFIEVMRH